MFRDLARRDEGNMIRDSPGESHLVRAQDDVLTTGSEFANQFKDFRGHFRIQRRGGFIKNEDFRGSSDGAGKSHPLLLAPGELGRKLVGVAGQTKPIKALVGCGGRLRRAAAMHLLQRQRDIAVRSQVREQIELLEEKAIAPPPCQQPPRIAIDPFAIDLKLSGVGLLKSAQCPQQRAFAAPARPNQGEHTDTAHIKRKSVESRKASVAPGQLVRVNLHGYI